MTQFMDKLKNQITSSQRKGDFKKSLSDCKKLCDSGSADAEVWYYKGVSEYCLGRDSDAAASCMQALKQQEGMLDARNLLGRVHMRQGAVKEAEKDFRQVLDKAPDHLSANENLVQLLLGQGKLESARVSLQCLLEKHPTHVQAWFFLGAACGQLGDFDQAILCCRKVIELNPEHVDAYYNLAQAYMHQRKHEDAVAMYQEVVKRRVDHFDAWNNIGVALHELNRPKEAIPYYRKALELRPDSAPTRFMLASAGGEQAPECAPSNYVQALFDKYADDFDKQLVEKLYYRTPELLNRLLRSVVTKQSLPLANLKVLDFGCGTGLMGPLLRDVSGKLVGVDLSSGMLEKAREKGVYDNLIVGDLSAVGREAVSGKYDIVTAADVFPYIGSMGEVFQQCRGLLGAGGLFALSVELSEQTETYQLRDTNRYAHSCQYVRQEACQAGFEELEHEKAVLRRNRGQPVEGYLFVFKATTILGERR